MEQESVPFLAYGLMTVTTLVLAFATVFDKTREIDTFLGIDAQEEPLPAIETNVDEEPFPVIEREPTESDEETQEDDETSYIFAADPDEKDVVEGEVRAIPIDQSSAEQS